MIVIHSLKNSISLLNLAQARPWNHGAGHSVVARDIPLTGLTREPSTSTDYEGQQLQLGVREATVRAGQATRPGEEKPGSPGWQERRWSE